MINNKYVFGLDIGTRSIVGTVGYMERDRFVVVAQLSVEHETRAMIDGQIHDISKVGQTIKKVKNQLEERINSGLNDVCIAAAGRVLRTVDVHTEIQFESEKNVKEEDVYALNSKAVETAYDEFLKKDNQGTRFYCVGNSVVKYYLNDYPIQNLVDHKAQSIGVDLIATFLPNDVVDGLYKAVEYAGLHVLNLTLEPIAAMMVAIPENYRMLNIALVDVGAGTSDISITKDGSIVSYGMLPIAGDILTEAIAGKCLVDFNTAEQIKMDYSFGREIKFIDIMGLSQVITKEELDETILPIVDKMAKDVADKLIDLNGGKPVSAVFVVGGGGKIPYYTEKLAGYLGIQPERVAIRGREVMGKIDFKDETIEKDSLLVTPIGICLSYYEQSNNFIFVTFNQERVKLYNNGRLAVVDAAMNADFASDGLFPRRGDELVFKVNGKERIVRGELGETAVITVNGKAADIHTEVHENDIINVIVSTKGKPAMRTVKELPEALHTIDIVLDGKNVSLPVVAYVNDEPKTEFYEIQAGDDVVIADYYTVRQIVEVLDISVNAGLSVMVNNQEASYETKVYANFKVDFSHNEVYTESGNNDETVADSVPDESAPVEAEESIPVGPRRIDVIVNGRPVTMNGKSEYIFVDIFDYIEFDLSKPQGKGIVTKVNGQPTQYMSTINSGDSIEVYWKND